MKCFFVCICAVLTLPYVTSIRCYDCNLCPSAKNVIDCNNDKDTPKYDACAKTTFEIDHDGHKRGMYYLTCTVKSKCDSEGELYCDKTALKTQGIIVSKCDHSCCSKDKCNAPDTQPGKIHLTSVAVNMTIGKTVQSAPTSVSSEATSAQLITTFLNLAVIFALIVNV